MPDPYLIESVRTLVWAGFDTDDAMRDQAIELTREEGESGDRDLLLDALAAEQRAKAIAETGWPAVTDCDRLDAAFAALGAQGIVALQHAGYTMSDGRYDVEEAADDLDPADRQGWAFYHGQDTERAVQGHGLWIAFGAYRDDERAHAQIGTRVVDALRAAGLSPTWEGDPAQRIQVALDWKRRAPAG